MQSSTLIDQNIFSLPCEEFYFTVASNPILLQKGYQIVYKYLSISPLNRQQTLLHLLSQKAPVLTLVTRTYPVVYSDQSVNLSLQQKAKTKEYLILQILLKQLVSNYGKDSRANKKNLGNVLLFLIHFHNNQGFEGWVVFYQKLLEEMIKLSSQLIGFILIELLKSSDDRVSIFSKHILPFIINNQGSIKMSQQESIQIIYYCIKSMAYMNGTQDDVLQQYFEPYEQKIIEYIFVSISKSINIMKFSLKILTVFVADYEIQLQKQLIIKLKQCAKQLTIEHLNDRIALKSNQQLDDEQDLQDQGHTTISVIIYQLIQLFETLLTAQQLKMNDYQLYLSICLPSLLLSKRQYFNYNISTETYLADIQDQSQKTLRNKVVSFFLQLYEGDYPAKAKGKLQAQILKYSLILQVKSLSEQQFGQQIINYFKNISLPINIKNQHLALFQQSITFLLYHLTQQILTYDVKNLQQNKQSLMMSLGKNIQLASIQNKLIKVSYVNLLNKLIKSMNKNVKQAYYIFLIQNISKINDYFKQKGFILSTCRGIAYVSNDMPLSIVQNQNDKGISIHMVENLIKYLLDTNTLQQSAHLILQFLLTLLKKVNNATNILTTLISTQTQMHILSTFIHDGTIADVVIDLLSQISSEELIKYIYGQFLKGFAKQQNLTVLISRWVRTEKLRLTENDLMTLLKAYKALFVSKLIKQFLCLVQKQKTAQNLSVEIISIFNDMIHPSWVLPMIGCNILRNPQILLLNTIQSITYELTSQYEIQNQLLLPYYTFINDCQFGVNLLKSKSVQLYLAFMNKLIRYGTLFQGPNLKVITSLVLLNICEIDNTQIKLVFQLIQSYGKTINTNDEWQDQKDQETVIDRMFNMRIINDEVQKQFLQIFGDKVFDMQQVTAKVQKLSLLINQ